MMAISLVASKCRYTNSVFPSGILYEFSHLMAGKVFCDIKVEVDDHVFDLHKIVLVSASKYFHTVLIEQDPNRTKQSITLPGVKADIFGAFINYVYSGKLVFDRSLLCTAWKMAQYLQMEDVCHWCMSQIVQSLSITNCVDYMEFAEKNLFGILQSVCETFIVDNFRSVSKLDSFHKLSVRALTNILLNDTLNCESESAVYTSFRRWLANNDKHLVEATKIMQNIRFGLITIKDNSEILRDDIMTDEDKAEQVHTAIGYLTSFDDKKPSLAGTFSTPRGNPTLLLCGGTTGNIISNAITTVDIKGSKVQDLAMIPLKGITGAVAVQHHNFLFIFGGLCRDPPSSINGYTLCLDITKLSWMSLAPMITACCFSAYFKMKSKVFILGGMAPYTACAIDNAQIYDINNDSWEMKERMPEANKDFAGCALDDIGYISGGWLSNGSISKSIVAYDEKRKAWEYRGKLLEARRTHAMATDGHILFIVGGTGSVGQKRLMSMEVYDPNTRQQSFLAMMPYRRSRIKAEYYENKIYVVGGYGNSLLQSVHSTIVEDDIDKESDTILIYDKNLDQWQEAEHKLSKPQAYSACVIIPTPISQ